MSDKDDIRLEELSPTRVYSPVLMWVVVVTLAIAISLVLRWVL